MVRAPAESCRDSPVRRSGSERGGARGRVSSNWQRAYHRAAREIQAAVARRLTLVGSWRMQPLLRDLLDHQFWADVELWNAIGGEPRARQDGAIHERLHHIHQVQRFF